MTLRVRVRMAAAALALAGLPSIAAARQAAAPPAPPASTQAAAPRTTGSGMTRPRTAPPRESLRAIRERGVLRACLAAAPPWFIEADADGQPPTGFAVDIATQLAQDIGVELEIVRTSAQDLIADLFEGDCDVIPGGLAATPDRALFLHFTTPIAEHAVEAVGPVGISGDLADLDGPDTTIGAVEGSAELQDARRRLPRATLRTFTSQAALGDALMQKQIQAAVVAAPFGKVASKLSGKAFTSITTPLARRRESLAVRRGDLEFLAYLNTWVQARVDEGWLAERQRVWFDTLDWVTPPAAPGR